MRAITRAPLAVVERAGAVEAERVDAGEEVGVAVAVGAGVAELGEDPGGGVAVVVR